MASQSVGSKKDPGLITFADDEDKSDGKYLTICASHPDRNAPSFCRTCEQTFCGKCMIGGVHDGHSRVEIEDIIAEKQREVKTLDHDLQNLLSAEKKQLNDDRASVKSVSTKLSRRRKELAAARQIAKQELQVEYKAKLDNLEKDFDEREETAAADNKVEEADAACIVLQTESRVKELQDALKGCSNLPSSPSLSEVQTVLSKARQVQRTVTSPASATALSGALATAVDSNSLAKDDNHGHGSFWNAGGDPLASLQIPSSSRQRGPNQAQAKHAQELTVGNKKIVIYQADITNVDVDVIVSPVGSGLEHYGGVANAIFQAAGRQYQMKIDEVQREMRRTYRKLGPQDVFPTFGFNLRYSFIYHVNSPVSKTDLKMAIEAVLREADKGSGVNSIAIPAIGTGQGSIRANKAAPIIVQTALEFRCRNLKEIHLVDFNTSTVTALKWAATEIEQRLKQHRN